MVTREIRLGSCAFVRAWRAAALPEHSHSVLRAAACPRIPAPQGSWRRRGTWPFPPPDPHSRVATLPGCRARLWMELSPCQSPPVRTATEKRRRYNHGAGVGFLARDPIRLALGLDPRVGAGFSERITRE